MNRSTLIVADHATLDSNADSPKNGTRLHKAAESGHEYAKSRTIVLGVQISAMISCPADWFTSCSFVPLIAFDVFLPLSTTQMDIVLNTIPVRPLTVNMNITVIRSASVGMRCNVSVQLIPVFAVFVR